VPELTESATRVEGAEIRERLALHAAAVRAGRGATAGVDGRDRAEDRARETGTGAVYSTCRTCEIGLSRAVGQPVRGIAHLVLEAMERA
jgi:hypothetical protein